MNAGEFPEGMSLERRDLVEALECLGFDLDEAAIGDWRTDFSDAELSSTLIRLTPQEPLHA